jgi:thiamine biosynthesis lipoprotein ApbE
MQWIELWLKYRLIVLPQLMLAEICIITIGKARVLTSSMGKKTSAKKRVIMRDAALATSGNYHQGNQSAFINPITNQQHKFKGSISVFAPSVMIADALTKVVLLTPKHSIKSILKCFDAQAIKINRFGFSKNI